MPTVARNDEIIIQKFGGTSVGDAQCIARVAQIIARAKRSQVKPVVVVSAMSGTTNALLNLCHAIIAEVNSVAPTAFSQHHGCSGASLDAHVSNESIAYKNHFFSHDAATSDSLFGLQNCNHNIFAEKDAALATGECLTSSLLAIALNSMSHPARSLQFWQIPIVTNSTHGKALVKEIDVNAIYNALEEDVIPIITGFTGISSSTGRVTTLGRGGSDTTALLLAAALNAKRCDIYTDVNGVYNADPRIIPHAQLKQFSLIDSRTMLALSASGAKVLATRCMEICYRYKIDVRVLSTFNLDQDGTHIYHTSSNRAITKHNRSLPDCIIGMGTMQDVERVYGKRVTGNRYDVEELFNAAPLDRRSNIVMSDKKEKYSYMRQKTDEVQVVDDCAEDGLEGIRVESIVVNKSLFLLTIDGERCATGLQLLIDREIEFIKMMHEWEGAVQILKCILPLSEIEQVKTILDYTNIKYNININLGAVSLVGYGMKNSAKLLQVLTKKLDSFDLKILMLEIGELVICAYVNSIDLHHFVASLHNALRDEFGS